MIACLLSTIIPKKMTDYRSIKPITKNIVSLNAPAIEVTKTLGGYPLYISETKPIGVIQIELFWGKGSFHQKQAFQSSLAGDLIFAGTKKRKEVEIVQFFDCLGASHHTDSLFMGSSIILRCVKKHYEKVFSWLLENASEACYPEQGVVSAISVQSAALERQQQTPKYWASRKSMETLYGPNHPLTRYGNTDDYQKIDSTCLFDYRREHLPISDCMLFLSGDIDKEIVAKTDTIMAHYPGGSFSVPKFQDCLSLPGDNTVVQHKVSNTNQVSLQMVAHVSPKNQKEKHQLTLLNMCLGGYFGSKLMQVLREEKGLTYGVSSYFQPAFRDFTWTISGEFTSANTQESFETIDMIFRDLRDTVIPLENLNKIKQYYAGQFRSGFDGPFGMSSKVQHLLYENLDMDYFETVLPSIWAISPKDLNTLANNYLHKESFIHVLAGDT